jgi:tRNA 2-thiouridine synthesizing protein A
MSPNQATEQLDARGLLCPLPVLKAKKQLKAMPEGAVLEILATDPGAPKDFEHFCKTTGYALLETRETGGVFAFLIRKASAD